MQKIKFDTINMAINNEKINFEKMKLTSKNEILSKDNQQLQTKKKKLEILNSSNIQLPKGEQIFLEDK